MFIFNELRPIITFESINAERYCGVFWSEKETWRPGLLGSFLSISLCGRFVTRTIVFTLL